MMSFNDFKDVDDTYNLRVLLIKHRKDMCQQLYDNRIRMMQCIIDDAYEFPSDFFDMTFIQIEQELKDEIFKSVFDEFLLDMKNDISTPPLD